MDQYLFQILENYRLLCDIQGVPVKMKSPTDAGLKKECIKALSAHNTLRDRAIVSDFLSCDPEMDALSRRLNNADAEKFRPCVNLLKGKTTNPADVTVELVKWLVDVNLEEAWKRVGEPGALPPIEEDAKKAEEQLAAGSQITAPDLEQKPVMQPAMNIPLSSKNIWLKRFKKNRILLILIALLTGGGFYASKFRSSPKLQAVMPNVNEKCMYWKGDHYEPARCSDTLDFSKKIIPLDIQELTSLKKITQPDTLTLADVGKVWYIKTNNKLEYFTAGGRYPLDTARKLKVLSKHMYDNYPLNKKSFFSWWPL